MWMSWLPGRHWWELLAEKSVILFLLVLMVPKLSCNDFVFNMKNQVTATQLLLKIKIMGRLGNKGKQYNWLFV